MASRASVTDSTASGTVGRATTRFFAVTLLPALLGLMLAWMLG